MIHSATTRTRCIKGTRNAEYWDVILEQQASKQHLNIKAKSVVNAAGPWVASLFEDVFTQPTPHTIRLVKGSHIVVPRLHDEPVAYILQNEDNRIVFVQEGSPEDSTELSTVHYREVVRVLLIVYIYFQFCFSEYLGC